MPATKNKQNIEALIGSDFVTPQTRAVLEARLAEPRVTTPQFFNEEQFKILNAVCARLIPQLPGEETVDLPGLLDTKLKEGSGKGWRYDTLPPDKQTFSLGLAGLNEVSKSATGEAFYGIGPEIQDEILTSVQNGTVSGMIWSSLPADRFFDELLAALVEIYYSHPLKKSAIGDMSFADAEGWQNIGLNETDRPQEENTL